MEEVGEGLDGCGVRLVAEGDGDVAQISLPFGAQNRCALVFALEILLCEGKFADQIGVGVNFEREGIVKVRILHAAVVGADRLAGVTAKDAVLQIWAQDCGDGTALLDGEVGEAAARIDGAVRTDGFGGTGKVTAQAAFAGVNLLWLIGLKGQIEEQFGKKDEGAKLHSDEARVFSDPSQAGKLGKVFLEDGGSVNAGFGVNGRTRLSLDEGG